MSVKNPEDLMEKLTIVGGIIALGQGIWQIATFSINNPAPGVVGGIFSIILGILALLSVFRTDDPIPFNWMVLLIVAILLFICGGWIGGIFIIIAAFIGIIEEYK